MNIQITSVMDQLQGIRFRVLGPFLVTDLSANQELYDQLIIGEHGMEGVPEHAKTQAHTHDFVSLYKSSYLDVLYENELFNLPFLALIVVLPGITHSWVPKNNEGWINRREACQANSEGSKVIEFTFPP